MVGNPEAGQEWVSARKRNGHNAIAVRLSKASASGRTICPTAISWRRCSTRRSTGTASARRTSSPRKTIRSTALRMLFGYLLTNTAQIFADVRTYWSPDAVKRVTGHKLTGAAAGGISAPDQLRPGHARRHRRTDRDGKPAMKPFWEITKDGSAEMPRRHDLASVHHGIFPRRRLVHPASSRAAECRSRCAGSISSRASARRCKSPKAKPSNLPEKVHATLDERTNPTWPTTWFAPRTDRATARSGMFTP